MVGEKLEPSEEIWIYFRGEITSLQVACGLADRVGGYHISYSMTQLLLDLNLITPKTHNLNKVGKRVLAHYLHREYHGPQCDIKVEVINPFDDV